MTNPSQPSNPARLLRLHYGPGWAPYRDSVCESVITDAIQQLDRATADHAVVLFTSTENIFHALCVAVRQGRISPEDVEVCWFNTYTQTYQDIRVYADGSSDHVDSYHERWLMQLF